MTIYKNYFKSILDICKDRFKVNYKIIKDYRIYYITLNDNYDKTIVFSAGIHGNEVAGIYAIQKFLTEYKESDIKIILFPVVNPYGFNHRIRYNELNQDINRMFCDEVLTNEAKAVYSVLSKNKPDLFVSLHEWNGEDGFYMYCSDKNEIYKKIPDIAKKYFKIFNNQKINNELIENGIIWHPSKEYEDISSKCTLENRMYMEGINYICIETPSKANLEKRVDCQVEIMKYILNNYSQ